MIAPDIDALETALAAQIMTVSNGATTPVEPAVRSTFNLLDEAMRSDDTPHAMPSVGIMHEDEPWEPNRLLGGPVSQAGRERWKLIVLCASASRDGGFRGERGAYTVSAALIDGLNGWQIADGCPIRIDRRYRYSAHNENGELVPIAGYVIEISHPVVFEN